MGAAQSPPATQKDFDIMKYTNGTKGKTWYDIFHSPVCYEPLGAHDITAFYRVIENAALVEGSPQVELVNTMIYHGHKKWIGGVAIANPQYADAEDGRGESKLLVKFNSSPFVLAFTPIADYWVLGVAPDYRYAIVSTPARNVLWILSETPHLSKEDQVVIREWLIDSQGFTEAQMDALIETAHAPQGKTKPQL